MNHDILSDMKIRTVAAITAVRITTLILRFFGSGGTSFPGKAAMLFQGNLLKSLAEKIKVIVITGTNGKTTSSRITAEILNTAGLPYFENKSGANLLSGITASFAMNCTLNGKPKYEYAVIECDEAAFKTVCPMLNPHTIVITNLFRDQLDRFGEITHTRNNIIDGIKASPGSIVVLNADDSLSYSISDEIPNEVLTYGLDSPPYGSDDDFLSDAPYCIKCKSPYVYGYRTYGHLGDFHCENCGYSRISPNVSADNIIPGPSSTKITIGIYGKISDAVIALPGAYNIYNALSAASAAVSLGIDEHKVIPALSSFKSGFGRMENLKLDGTDVHMILVKNPAGINQVINYMSSDSSIKNIVLILNDYHADGTDISWIWDANFEKFTSFMLTINKIIVSGKRAEELALRFKYAGMNPDIIYMDKDYNSVIDSTITDNTDGLPVYILPTYTAMFDFRKALSKRYKIRKFWK